MPTRPNQRVLIAGYHGMGNIGADARLVALEAEIHRRAPDVEIVVNSFTKGSLDGFEGVLPTYVHPAMYFSELVRQLRRVDLIILSEGNFLTDEFTSHMVRGFCSAVGQASRAGVPSFGMALDSGRLSAKRVPATVAALNRLDDLTIRSAGAVKRLRAMGVTREINLTADCAVSMALPSRERVERVAADAGLGGGQIIGLAPVDFYMWPAEIRPIGRRADYVRWPFKATWPDDGRRRSRDLIEQWIGLVNRLQSEQPSRTIALVAMERIDESFCDAIITRSFDPSRCRRVYSGEMHPLDMSAALSRLDALVSSRYHAVVLSLAHAVPFVGLGHDTRMRFLIDELGLEDAFINYDSSHLTNRMEELLVKQLADADSVRARIRAGFAAMQKRDAANYEMLGERLDACTR